MSFELYCINGDKQYNITPIIGSFSWGKDITELAVKLKLTTAHNDDRYFPENPIDIGTQIILRHTKDDIGDNETVFQGIVISEEKNGREPINYTVVDVGYWLNKSKETIQFNKVNSKVAITSLLNRFNVDIGEITSMRTVINDDYNGAVSDIIKDIIEVEQDATGKKLLMEFEDNKLYIKEVSDDVFRFNFSIADNISLQNTTDYIIRPTRKRTIENMVNKIKVVYTSKKHIITAYEASDNESVSKYGILQEVISTSKKEVSKAKQIAKNKLKELNKIVEQNSITIPGNYKLKPGYIIELNEETTGMIGKYRIKKTSHFVNNGIYMCTLDLEVI